MDAEKRSMARNLGRGCLFRAPVLNSCPASDTLGWGRRALYFSGPNIPTGAPISVRGGRFRRLVPSVRADPVVAPPEARSGPVSEVPGAARVEQGAGARGMCGRGLVPDPSHGRILERIPHSREALPKPEGVDMHEARPPKSTDDPNGAVALGRWHRSIQSGLGHQSYEGEI